ncbi:GNAT family N-acetyltransferase [Roseateles oligotrophus]|uniref:GNAT family N-acetyltransferase n=1 Tax=Roseateles oligotrophus TaxID=1769250 RepID=A0ABT2YCG1_9BURK|nr:GNAT family N-acetyltransferase [Roseateles oligotrophus]MCV2367719.1 GNAT family N-acetyltransferase [Roseateles oligotrophus]
MQSTKSTVPISLHEATAEDLPRIENLMQFYNYDLSEFWPVEFSATGLYALRPKEAYWAKPSVRPYIAKIDGELAGFAVVDDEVQDPQSQFNLGYFFLGRRYRGSGAAQEMLRLLFERHPGRWEVYFFVDNLPAARFWPKAIAQQTGDQEVLVTDTDSDGLPCRLYRFSSL